MSKEPATNKTTASLSHTLPSTAPSSVVTPASSSVGSPARGTPFTAPRELHTDKTMDDTEKDQTAAPSDRQEQATPVTTKPETAQEDDGKNVALVNEPVTKKSKCTKAAHKKRKHARKPSKKRASKDDSDVNSSSTGDSSEDSSDSSEIWSKKKGKPAKSKKKKKRHQKNKKVVGDSESDSSDSEASDDSTDSSSSEEDVKTRKSKKSKHAKQTKNKKSRMSKKLSGDSGTDLVSGEVSTDDMSALQQKMAELQMQIAGKSFRDPFSSLSSLKPARKLTPKSLRTIKAMATKPAVEPAVYKRVDQLWDSTIHNYKLKESAEEDDSQFAEFAFLVRRTFDWENKYRDTVVDIKSKLLRAALVDVMKDCKSVALEVAEPTLDPNLLFLYLEELRTYYKTTLKAKIKAEKKKKAIKKLEQQRKIVKVLVRYLDEDYEDTKKTLYPLLEAGNITFDLLWALFKPNEIALTSCYGIWSEPRCFKVEYANKCASLTRGEWYCIEGRYLEYDGKSFGFGDFEDEVPSFKGPRKITSLNCFPLKYHQHPEKVKQQILERSEKFLNLEGMHYKFHKGLAFMKKKKQVLKININSRIMLDPATFRRVNPNYPISWIKPKEDADLFSLSDDDSEGGCSCEGDSEDGGAGGANQELSVDEDRRPRYKYKWTKNDKGQTIGVRVEVDDDGHPVQSQRVEKAGETLDGQRKVFTEEELLLTTPVMLGFAFSEKLWLEFTISGVRDIVYNEDAFESLVLPPNQKSIVKAQVESHKFHGAKTIDDVVQGKGKGLVAVLHGPPGTGKTLTAEGIAELLKCPLYMVSAGELGTDSSKLEFELQKILDIAHSWGAVLLLDEADVFLEKREVHDIHRNALVSIFLRLLEYFQGILFLTTNRVETFDDAFQSRIHIALRYNELNQKARKAVWTMFLDKVKNMEGLDAVAFSDTDLELLSRNQLNGRQIKNLVRTAQALALNEQEKLTMEHIKRVIEVAESFGHDLKGGTGYLDAMRSYT